MAALTPPSKAPDFALPAVDGAQIALQDLLRRGPVVVAFFKDSCPTCQYTFPYLERLFRAYLRQGISLVGIAQDARERAAAFMKTYGISFPVLLDDTRDYPVSNAYGIEYVPTIYLISQQGAIEFLSEGWMRKEIEDLNARMARAAGITPAPLFTAGEDVLSFKGG